MIILVWFTVVMFIMMVGMTIVGLTFRHWYLESRARRQKAEQGAES